MKTKLHSQIIKNVFFAVSLFLLLPTIACQIKKEQLLSYPGVFEQIRRDYYQQLFVDKGITKYSDYIQGYANTEYDRYIKLNSFYIYDYYGFFDGYYCVDFLINAMGSTGSFLNHGYEFNNQIIYIDNHNPPVFWKDGKIYELEEMSGKGIPLDEDYILQLRTFQSLVYDMGLPNSFEEILSVPTKKIYYRYADYENNLPSHVK